VVIGFHGSNRGSIRAMATLQDPGVQQLLSGPNYATIATFNPDGAIHSTVIWISAEDGTVAVNSAVGRVWPSNLERDPRVTVVVQEANNPYDFVEIRGTATGTREGADEHINALAKKYIGQDEYPFRQPGEERIKFTIQPDRIRHVKQN
jgi:PPOX class probable F420-dependent enzyme